MSGPLWTSDEITAATGGALNGDPFETSGVTFDSREVEPGWLFVAMPGTIADGHDYVGKAFAAGATAALVSNPVEGPHVLVDDVARALTDLAIAGRGRVTGTVIGVTGSVGKTSTKEALYAALNRFARGRVHRSVKSYNNHTGVPLSLARMPRDSEFAVLEMGMNRAGEIAALTRLVRPNVALVTTIASAHIEHLGSMEAIADAKAEIFEGLEPDGVAILPEDTPYRDRLVKAARLHADRIVTFGNGRGRCGRDARRPGRKWRQPGHGAASGERDDLYHRPARRSLGVQFARRVGGGRGGQRRPRHRRSGAG